MTIQDDLRQNTIDIAEARNDVAYYQREVATLRHTQTEADALLAIAVRRHMADSGLTNETARRAYAERETDDQRAEVSEIAYDLLTAEKNLITAQTALAIALDKRRVLEATVRLMVDTAADWLQTAYATADEMAF